MRSKLAVAVFCVSLSGCGPESPTDSATSTEAGTTAAATTAEVPTTGGTPLCGGVALPQALPPGTEKPYWLWQAGARQVYFSASASGFSCETPIAGPCAADDVPALNFIYVVLGPQHQAVGVYPIGELSDNRPMLFAYLSVTVDGTCEPEVVRAVDGEVEVLAIDDDCVAIDIRGVSPLAVGADFTVAANGSAMTAFCPM